MENRFKQSEADACIAAYAQYPPELALRIYTSRLLGRDPALVLHGGGNTSVKLIRTNIVGEEEAVLFVKGSGADLASIEPEGFTGLRLDPLHKLLGLDTLSDLQMRRQIAIHRISAAGPDPSVEALLHAFLPHRYVDHTHADSILILSHQRRGRQMLAEALGSKCAIIPYIMSGYPLARAVLQASRDNPGIEAVVVMHHGLFTFAEEARIAYKRMIRTVGRAEAYIAERSATKRPAGGGTGRQPSRRRLARCLQTIRGSCAHSAGGRWIRFLAEARTFPDLVAASLAEGAEELCHNGVLTPDHAIRTKNRVLYVDRVSDSDETFKTVLQAKVDAFQKDYRRRFQKWAGTKEEPPVMADPYPRLFLVAGIGLVALGATRREARIAADIGVHTLRAKRCAQALGAYCAIPEAHALEMEYWAPQQKKLGPSAAAPLQGQVALVTGGGGAIGLGIADRLLEAGAVVVIADIDGSRLKQVHDLLTAKYDPRRVLQSVLDVTDFDAVSKVFETISARLGGIDLVVPNAGIAHVATIENLDPQAFDRVIDVNLKGTFTVIKAAVPVFRRQGSGGNIVLISTKNVFDPGAAFGAYSASKAGAHQLARIAALELAELGVRVNMVNPDAVFGDETVCSLLWETVGPERMKARGLDAAGLKEYYCQRSLLKVRVLAEHVGNAVVFFASDLTPTTGAALPVDAGNPATFSR